MVEWDAREALSPGALDRHCSWYARVDASTGVSPPMEQIQPFDRFPTRFRSHLFEAVAAYEPAITDDRCV